MVVLSVGERPFVLFAGFELTVRRLEGKGRRAGSMRVMFLSCHRAVAGVVIGWKLDPARGGG